jgi:hypothetical protein
MEDPFGVAYIWLRGASMDDAPDAFMRGDIIHTCVGFRVASAGDIDGDGRDEVMAGNYPASPTWRSVWVCKYTGTGVSEAHPPASSVPKRRRISCAPNPFGKSTVVKVIAGNHPRHPSQKDIIVAVHDVAGRVVTKLSLPAPSFQAIWDGCDEQHRGVPSGTYFVTAEGVRCSPSRVVLLK